VQNKITLSAGDRPASAALGCGLSGTGFATAITIHTNGTLEFANTNGYYTNGGIRGQVVYTV